jgi:hypothetical protein
MTASRYVCWAKHGRLRPKHHDEHSCGNLWCVNAGHLQWARVDTKDGRFVGHERKFQALTTTVRRSGRKVLILLKRSRLSAYHHSEEVTQSRTSSKDGAPERTKGIDFIPEIISSTVGRNSVGRPEASDVFVSIRMAGASAPEPMIREALPIIHFAFTPEEAAQMQRAMEPEPEPAHDRLAAIMADPILHDPRWFGLPHRPAPAPILSDESWAETLEREARYRRRAAERIWRGQNSNIPR